jgi:glycosyltransferase involved in cell wall biosynthesis
MQGKKPLISVIIPALDEEKYISYPISGLKRQTFKDFETIFVDGGSTDSTVDIASRYAKVITEPRKGVAIGRNKGAGIAKGDILLFLDADTKPSSGLLATYAKAFKENDIVAATGPIYPIEKTDVWTRWGYEFVSIWYVKFTILVRMPAIVGSNFAVRADAFRKVHGFDPKLLTYEDWDLSNKLKKAGRIEYIDSARVQTSARRVLVWGIWGYFLYHTINMIMYNIFGRTRKNYKTIR